MFKVKVTALDICVGLVFFALSLLFFACGSSPSSSSASGASAADAQAAAQAALDRMDGRGPAVGQTQAGQTQVQAQPSSGSAPVSAQAAQQGTAVSAGLKPAWVDSVDSVYSRVRYVAAVGYASDRAMAERNALVNLTAFFGQSIQADQTITNTYYEAVRSGAAANWTDSVAMDNTIRISTSMDSLVGAEIKEVWFDSKNTYYAAAVLEKAKAAQMYNEMILANQNMIENLITMPASEKNSLEGISRYQFAAAMADINIFYGNLLKLIDSVPPAGLKSGDEYRLEAQSIVRAIPIGIRVTNDKSGRIQGAFAKALSDLGFRSGGNNSRYVLQTDITVSPVDLPNNQNKFVRIELGANLTDTGAGSVLLPYNFSSREGHTSVSEAENRAYSVAERKINEEYRNLLSAYLSQLLPKK